MNRIISEALASLEATNYSATETSHNAKMVRKAIELLKSPLATALDVSNVKKFHAHVEEGPIRRSGEVVFVSDLATIQPPSGQVGEAVEKLIEFAIELHGTEEELKGCPCGLEKVIEDVRKALRQPVETVDIVDTILPILEAPHGDPMERAVKIERALRTQPQAPSLEDQPWYKNRNDLTPSEFAVKVDDWYKSQSTQPQAQENTK